MVLRDEQQGGWGVTIPVTATRTNPIQFPGGEAEVSRPFSLLSCSLCQRLARTQSRKHWKSLLGVQSFMGCHLLCSSQQPCKAGGQVEQGTVTQLADEESEAQGK